MPWFCQGTVPVGGWLTVVKLSVVGPGGLDTISDNNDNDHCILTFEAHGVMRQSDDDDGGGGVPVALLQIEKKKLL